MVGVHVVPTTDERGELMTLPRTILVVVCMLMVSVAAGADQPTPSPPEISLTDLPDPFPWPSSIFNNDPVTFDFQVDLDLLAPLGTKPGNGAEWFARFQRQIGERRQEVERAQEFALGWEFYGKERKVLPPDHPLLIEAEPWVDSADWSFYPEVWPWQGGSTPIANHLFALQLGRSWVARGQAASNPETALADYRRTVRLGRLLLQDDVVLIQNLIGIALIRTGTEAIFDHARAHGDGAVAALAALAIQDCTALRLELTRRFQRLAVFQDFVSRVTSAEGVSRTELRLPDDRFATLIQTATSDPIRALRIEVVTPLWITSHIGTDAQRKQAQETLDAMAQDSDEMVAVAAKLILDRSFDAGELDAHWSGSDPAAAQ